MSSSFETCSSTPLRSIRALTARSVSIRYWSQFWYSLRRLCCAKNCTRTWAKTSSHDSSVFASSPKCSKFFESKSSAPSDFVNPKTWLRYVSKRQSFYRPALLWISLLIFFESTNTWTTTRWEMFTIVQRESFEYLARISRPVWDIPRVRNLRFALFELTNHYARTSHNCNEIGQFKNAKQGFQTVSQILRTADGSGIRFPDSAK